MLSLSQKGYSLVWSVFPEAVWEGTYLTGYHCNAAGQSVGEPGWFCAITSWQGTEQTGQSP